MKTELEDMRLKGYIGGRLPNSGIIHLLVAILAVLVVAAEVTL